MAVKLKIGLRFGLVLKKGFKFLRGGRLVKAKNHKKIYGKVATRKVATRKVATRKVATPKKRGKK